MGIKLELRFRDLYNSWSNLFIEFDINGDICENVISYDNNYFGVRYYYEQIRGKGNEYYGKIKSKASDYI